MPGLGPVHAGFLAATDSLFRQSGNEIAEWARGDFPIFVAGHSLGGAVATLAAHRLAIEYPFRRVCLATFGSPRVVSSVAHDEYDAVDIAIRVVYRDDLVPAIPIWRYKHVGHPLLLHSTAVGRWLRGAGINAAGRGWQDHSIENYVDWTPETHSGWPSMVDDEDALEDAIKRGY